MVLILACFPLFFTLFMFLPAGTWAWTKGWLFILALLGIISFVLLVLHRVNPEVLIARSRTHKGTKRWDRILLGFFFPTSWAIVPIAALKRLAEAAGFLLQSVKGGIWLFTANFVKP